MKSKVYFTKTISPESLQAMYHTLGISLPGKIAIKLHSGEMNNQNYLRPEFFKQLIDELHGTVVECNTAYGDYYGGIRDHTLNHKMLLEQHGWTKYFKVDLMDAEGPDVVFKIPNGKILKENYVGKNLLNYDSMLVLTHFKGHPMGGYGGALKQLSIGCASSAGKALIHSGGASASNIECWQKHAEQDKFLEAMADAASSVTEHFKGRIAYINTMKNLSVDCDCVCNAEDPCMKDIGILASLDPVAVDQACMDLIYKAKDDPGQKHFLERVNSRHGTHILEAAEALRMGSREYDLIVVD